jgi:chromosomal replication initiator protein
MTPQEAWRRAYQQLELQYNREAFTTWLSSATFLRAEGDTFVIGVENGNVQNMLANRLNRTIEPVVSAAAGREVTLLFEVRQPSPAQGAGPLGAGADDMPLFHYNPQMIASTESLREAMRPPTMPMLPESVLNPQYTFDRFIVSGSNRIVYEASLSVTESISSLYNPLFIYGGSGLGKTHLLHAIAHAYEARGLRAIYVPSEAFMNDFVQAIRRKTTALFRDRYRTADALLIDDVQFIADKESVQEEIFNTYNTLANFNKQVVLAADRHPGKIRNLQERLLSRFQCGLVADLQPLELETRIAILQMWCEERGVVFAREVLETIASTAPNSARELQGAFNQVVVKTGFQTGALGRSGTVELLNHWRSPMKSITLQSILEATAGFYGIAVADLTSARRLKTITHARHVAMYLCREMTDASLEQIGMAFERKHPTVVHAVKKMGETIAQDEATAAAMVRIRQTVQRGQAG